MDRRLFLDGQRVRLVHSMRPGTVEYLRDDKYERERRAVDGGHYFYSVRFDDGTFDTYVAQSDLAPLVA
jgi:hypothetical protein